MARVFENDKGDWKKVEKALKDAQPWVDVLEELSKRMAKATAELEAILLDAYKTAPKIDCLYYDSPISPNAQTHYLKSYLYKLGWRGVRDVSTNKIDIKEFSKEMELAMKWLTKYQQ